MCVQSDRDTGGGREVGAGGRPRKRNELFNMVVYASFKVYYYKCILTYSLHANTMGQTEESSNMGHLLCHRVSTFTHTHTDATV